MANRGGESTDENFFDVLIDRLIIDVKNDFEASIRDQNPDPSDDLATAYAARDSIFDEPPKKRAPQFDDLVSKMIGFRSRLTTPGTSRSQSPYQLAAPRKFETSAIAIGTASASRTKAQPKFASSDAQVAYTVLLKSGAQFFAEDMIDGAIARDAMKRERRRVLLTLHPDRVPETDRARAHEAFLAAAEAFSNLADSTGANRAA